MKKIYLDVDKTIWVDIAEEKIHFDKDNGKSFVIGGSLPWRLFLVLLKNIGNPVKVTDLEKELIKSGGTEVKMVVNQLKKALVDYGIPCNLRKNDKDTNKIIIENVRASGKNKGAYILILPHKNEKILTDLYWKNYNILAIQKEGERRNIISGKIGQVYQLPQLISSQNGKLKWDIEKRIDEDKENILVEAPNGYGKTSLLKSILFSSMYSFKNNLSEDEQEKYKSIRMSHGISSEYLCIFIECKDIVFCTEEGTVIDWLYTNLSKSIMLDKYLDGNEFGALISEYNKKGKLLLLIDGYDEIDEDIQKELLARIEAFQNNDTYGNHSLHIMTTRPLFYEQRFRGYQKWKIDKIDALQNYNWIETYVKNYSNGIRNIDSEKICDAIKNNFYLIQMANVPAIILWMIKAIGESTNTCNMVESMLSEMMSRYKYVDIINNLYHYKRVYEEIAFRYLCTSGEKGADWAEYDFAKYIRDIVDNVSETEERFKQVFKKFDEDVYGKLFFTNIALLEYQQGKLTFTNPIFAYHLCAKKILRLFKNEEYNSGVCKHLNLIPWKDRYHVMVVASSIVMNGGSQSSQDDNFGFDAQDTVIDQLEKLFFDYIIKKWESAECAISEKQAIQNACAHILLEYYGVNVYSNTEEQDYKTKLRFIVCANIENDNDDVKKCVEQYKEKR